ncbi:DoxX family protein [Streptomyces sp. NPDC058459]|uniref:DoxX family protein n=1 Tax=Streptomyces sp. NPDC058459 TaxID=3346508 RepID=UPI0036581950
MGRRKDLGLLAVRLGTGGVLAAHGAQKLLGWFGGGGIDGTGTFMESIGFRPGKASAIASGAAELGGGVLLAAGLGTPAAGAAVAGGMAGAVSLHWPNGFFATAGGYEYPAYLGYIATCVGVTGPGRYSLDRLIGYRLDRPPLVLLSFVLSAAGTAVVVARREKMLADQRREETPPVAP